MFKWIDKRREVKQRAAQKEATRQLLTLAGFLVTDKYIAEHCHLCDERKNPLFTIHTETSPNGEELPLKIQVGCACLRCGFIDILKEGYSTIYEKRHIPVDIFVNDYLERQLT